MHIKEKLICVFIGGLFLLLFSASCVTQNGLLRTEILIRSVGKHFVPDSRVAIFEIKAVSDGKVIDLTGVTTNNAAHLALIDSLDEEHIYYRDQIRLLPDTSVGSRKYAIVNNSVCNIRTHPDHPAELSTQSTLGTLLRVYEHKQGWYRVQTPDHYIGWVDAGGIYPVDSTQAMNWLDSPRVIYTKQVGFTYIKPDLGSLHVSDIVEGNILEETGHAGHFVEVRYPDGRQAYVPVSSVERFDKWVDSRDPTISNVISTAETFLGEPYLWGGTSPKGFDCSGFTKTAFYLNGVILPRDADQQAYTGFPVPTDTTLRNLREGDLLFFGHAATKSHKGKIVHVAIYLGNGKFINSAGSVRIESLRRGDPDFNAYRLKTLLLARRLFPITLFPKTREGEVANLLARSKFYLPATGSSSNTQ